MDTSPIAVGAENGITRLLAMERSLLDLTLDQLRTLVIVRETGSALKASRILGREQSSIQKQIETLNRQLERVCGEVAVRRVGRGKDFLFTHTGEAVASWSASTLRGLITEVDRGRQRIGRALTVGTTEFTLGHFARIWPKVRERLLALDVELKLVHVRTRNFWDTMKRNEVDLLWGGVPAVDGHAVITDEYEFLEFDRDSLALLTNLTEDELPQIAVTSARLARLPLILPESGIIVEFIRRWYGDSYRRALNISAEIDDIYYGLALLRSRLIRGVMLILDSVGDAVIRGNLPTSSEFRKVPLAENFVPRLGLVSGVVIRTGERDRYSADHPLNIVWAALEEDVRRPNKSTPTAYATD